MHSILHLLPLLAETTTYTDNTGATTGGVVSGLVGYLIYVAAVWPTLRKAGYPGWLALIPIVNTIFLIKVSGLSGWWVLLLLVPIANVVLLIIVALRTGRAFGHGALFSIFLLWLLAIIGYFWVGYSRDVYDPARI